ncbi:hypothetical protein M2158_004365 [Streptomyces sp. SAI-144]|nr:hypothetical protein [Streptomyces sp. SAI-144]
MGEVFAGRYELADPIGRGGVGAVWRAWDHRRRRYVAAKVLLQSDAHSLLRFVREQALRIDHPHVLAPASWAADDDKVLFTMDLVAGGSLVHLVGDYGPLPPVFVCTLLDQLLAGLAAVHAEGVVHRDIKPANILLEATGTARPRLRLSDFGIAMRLGEPRLTETNLVVGTPGYLAPEQMMGAEPDFPADLFAVGLVALYLLEGAKPDAKALIQYFAAHGTPGAPQSVPEPLWQVVASLLQPDPQARFRTATGARKALAAARELLPDPGPDDESIEIFDQLGPLPPGFGPEGPLKRAPGVDPSRTRNRVSGAGGDPRFGTGDGSGGSFGGGGVSGVPFGSGGGAVPSGTPGGSGAPSGGGGANGAPSGGGESAGAFAVGGGGGAADWRGAGAGSGAGTGSGTGVGSGASAEPSAGVGSGADSGAGAGFGAGSDVASGAGAGFGAGSDVASGAGEADGASAWPGQGDGVTSLPGAANGGGEASSWFGEGNGVGSQPGEAGGAASRPGEGNGPASSQPGEAGGAPFRPREGNGPTFSQPGEAGGAPFRPREGNGPTFSQPGEAGGASYWPDEGNGWSSQPGVPGGVPSWHGEESGIPPYPREASEAPRQRGGSDGSAHLNPGTGGSDAPFPSTAPGTGSETPWPTPHTPPAPNQPPWVSDTGSFHLPPPRPADSRSQPSTPPEHQAQPHHQHPQAQEQPYRAAPAHSTYVSPHDPTPPTHVLPSPQPHAPRFPTQAPTPVRHQPHADTSTASYTAQGPQVPPPARSLSRARRSGPPAKVAIPLLLLALACYAVGFWALTQI